MSLAHSTWLIVSNPITFLFFFNNWRVSEKTVPFLCSRNNAIKGFHTSTNSDSEGYIGFLVSCVSESFYNAGDFHLNSIHRDLFYLQHTILQGNLSSCS